MGVLCSSGIKMKILSAGGEIRNSFIIVEVVGVFPLFLLTLVDKKGFSIPFVLVCVSTLLISNRAKMAKRKPLCSK